MVLAHAEQTLLRRVFSLQKSDLDHVANPSADHHFPIRSLHAIYAPTLNKEFFHLRPLEIDRAASG